MGVGKLPEQTRLADTGFADHRNNLTMTCSCLFKRLTELLGFCIASDKARESASGGGLQARARWSGADDFVDLHLITQAFNADWAERLHLHITFGKSESIGSHQDRSWHGHLLHARSQMCCLTDGGVIHVQIISDGANNYFTGVQADTNLNRDPVCTLNFSRLAFHRFLHPKRRVARSHRVI